MFCCCVVKCNNSSGTTMAANMTITDTATATAKTAATAAKVATKIPAQPQQPVQKQLHPLQQQTPPEHI